MRVEFEGGATIAYSYDAAGGKVQELVGGAGPLDYVGNFIYKENRLQYILTSEGRTVYDGDQDVFKEEFFVKDHLGNVRSVIDVTESPIRQYLATYEIASANLEGLLFDHHNEVRDDKPGSYVPEDGKSARLNGAEADRRIGTSLLVQVMAGDRVAMNVNNYYESYNPLKDNTVSASLMLDAIVGTLAGGGGGIPGEANNPEMVGQLFTPTNYSAINDILESATDPTMPKAYLNYVLFDHDMNIVSSMTGAFQANGSGDWAEIGTTAPMEMPVNGYLAVYLSNSSTQLVCNTCSDVYFDHLAVRVSKGRLLEEEHYYPHGLPMAGMGARAGGFKENRHRYQGKEYIKEQGLNWMDFHARQYDPQIGRFLGVDPLSDYGGQDRFSPYAAMGNMPESMIDPDGMSFRGGIKDLKGPVRLDLAIGSGSDYAEVGGFLGLGLTGGNEKSSWDGLNDRYNLSFNWGQGAAGTTITDPAAIRSLMAMLPTLKNLNSIGDGEQEKPFHELKNYDKIGLQGQGANLSACGYATLSMVFDYYSGDNYSPESLERIQNYSENSGIPVDFKKLLETVYYKEKEGSRYSYMKTTNQGQVFNNMNKGVASIVVLNDGALGFSSPSHAIIPVAVYGKHIDGIFIPTLTKYIDPGTGRIEQTERNIWQTKYMSGAYIIKP